MAQPPARTRKGADKNRPVEEGSRLGREVLGLCAIFCGLIVTLSLATFDSRDPWINHSISNVARIYNKTGAFGAYLSGSLFDIFGMGAWVAPIFFCVAGARRILGAKKWVWLRWVGFFLLALCVCMLGAASDTGTVNIFPRSAPLHNTGDVSSHGGGLVGHMLYAGIAGFMGPVGAFLIWLCLLLLAVQLLTGVSWAQIGRFSLAFLLKSTQEIALRASELRNAARQAKVARAGRKAEEAFDLVAIEGLPPELESGSPQNGSTPPGASYGLPEDIYTPREEFLDKLDKLDNEKRKSEPSASSSKRKPRQGRLIEDGGSSSRNGTQGAPVQPVLLRDDAELSDDAYHDDSASEAGQASGFHFDGANANIPPWLQAIDQPDEYDGDIPPRGAPASPAQGGDGREDFLHALWREAGHEVVPSEYLNRLIPPSDDSGPGGVATSSPYEAPPPAPSVSSGAKANGPASKATDADFAGHRAGQAPDSPNRVKHFEKETRTRDSVPDGDGAQAEGAREPVEKIHVPIFEAEGVKPAPEAPREGFVGSVLKRMKRPALVPLPPLDLLQAASKSNQTTPRGILEKKGISLMNCLRDFNVQGELVGITPGPVVTMFEVRPAPGVRVSRIANLNDDLALALKAVAVRIQAPVPGTDTVGIEIPNELRETVCLKELLGSQLFHQSKSLLTLALGKDIAGNPAVADLSTMPHLLVAGATGAGKSVGINSIILSILYKARPHEVKLLLVDPKRVEMAIYADLPHLVHPVVTEMPLAKNALEWAVAEMEQRYDSIARAGVRNVADYNAKVAGFGDNPPEGMEDLSFMPYLVIIIDELADLMLVAAKEVETSIVRLAQLARAAGIHLILATQRPSVDVVTGLIKANFPCRISFQVTSKHDSRTILDSVGAEHLLGKGDMLFKPGGGKFQRMHGAFVSDKDVHAVVNYWKSQLKPEYSIDFAEWNSEGTTTVLSGNGGGPIGGDIASDPMYGEAVAFVRQQGKASISLIQRKFRIGFNKAARYVEQMEQDGIIGAADGSKPRLVIG